MNLSKLMQKIRLTASVSKFGEIPPLLQYIKGLFGFGQSFYLTLVQFECFWANFHCCKWPNIENTIWPIWSHCLRHSVSYSKNVLHHWSQEAAKADVDRSKGPRHLGPCHRDLIVAGSLGQPVPDASGVREPKVAGHRQPVFGAEKGRKDLDRRGRAVLQRGRNRLRGPRDSIRRPCQRGHRAREAVWLERIGKLDHFLRIIYLLSIWKQASLFSQEIFSWKRYFVLWSKFYNTITKLRTKNSLIGYSKSPYFFKPIIVHYFSIALLHYSNTCLWKQLANGLGYTTKFPFTYRQFNHAFWSLSIERRLECFVNVPKC